MISGTSSEALKLISAFVGVGNNVISLLKLLGAIEVEFADCCFVLTS